MDTIDVEAEKMDNAEDGDTTGSPDYQDETDKGKSNANKRMHTILDETTRVGRKLGEAFKGMADSLSSRDNVVMVRVNDDTLNKLDQLVSSGIFRSRSEAGAFLFSRGIQAEAKLFDSLSERVMEIERLREELREFAREELGLKEE